MDSTYCIPDNPASSTTSNGYLLVRISGLEKGETGGILSIAWTATVNSMKATIAIEFLKGLVHLIGIIS